MQWSMTLSFALSELLPLSFCWCKGLCLFTGDSGFQFLACLWCQQVHHSTCLPQITCKDMGFFPLWGPGSAFKTGCNGKGIVQSSSWPLTPSLGCTFLAREGQSSLPKAKMTLLLWVKRNQNFKIYLGKKCSGGFLLFTLPCSCEKEQFGFNFAVIGWVQTMWNVRESVCGEDAVVCSRCFSRCNSSPSPELFYWMRRESSQEGEHKMERGEKAASGCAEMAVSGMPTRQNVNVTSAILLLPAREMQLSCPFRQNVSL